MLFLLLFLVFYDVVHVGVAVVVLVLVLIDVCLLLFCRSCDRAWIFLLFDARAHGSNDNNDSGHDDDNNYSDNTIETSLSLSL